MTDPSPAPAPAPAASQEDTGPSLLEILGDLGRTLVQSELPAHSDLNGIVGAIVKVLAHAGIDVADELWPAEPVPAQRPEAVDASHRAQTNSRLDRVETLLEQLVSHLGERQ